ncbi:hypothetical protein BH18ACI2_BH18ACI2_28140 [soil metagenome]
MAIRKLRNQRTDARLLLEAEEPVELPPAEVEEGAVVAQFDNFRPFIPELLETLRAGTLAELVPVMLDGSTFAVHGLTRTFWVKLWHATPEHTRIDRVQILSCLPSTRGLQIVFDDADEPDEFDEAEFDNDGGASDEDELDELSAEDARERGKL